MSYRNPTGSLKSNQDGFVSASKKCCFECGEVGHISKFCPSKQKAKVLTCNFCKEEGHIIKDCLALANTVCQHCNQTGHTIKRCPVPKVCAFCKEDGHLEYECNALYNNECEKCGMLGHVSEGCVLEPMFRCTNLFASFVCHWCHKNAGVRVIEDVRNHNKLNLCWKCIRQGQRDYGIVGVKRN